MYSEIDNIIRVIEKIVELTPENVGIFPNGCRERAFLRVLENLEDEATLFDCDWIDLEKCLETLTNNGKPENGVKLSEQDRITKTQKMLVIPLLDYIFEHKEEIKEQLEKTIETERIKQEEAIAKEHERDADDKSFDIRKVINKICRYEIYDDEDLDVEELWFEVDPGKAIGNEYSDTTLMEKKLILAIYKDVEVRWYEKSRGRGLGANFTTNERSLEEWLEMAMKEVVPEGLMAEYLDKIEWPDNYDEIYGEMKENYEKEDEGEMTYLIGEMPEFKKMIEEMTAEDFSVTETTIKQTSGKVEQLVREENDKEEVGEEKEQEQAE